MSGTGTSPRATFSVEMGPTGPRLRVRIGDRSIPIDIAPEQAADLATALLAASAFCSPGHPRPREGSTFGASVLPIGRWKTGIANTNRWPVLFATVRGGAQVVLSFPPDQAAECANALGATAADALAIPAEGPPGAESHA